MTLRIIVLFIFYVFNSSSYAHRVNLYEVISGDYERIRKVDNLPISIKNHFIKKGWCTGLGEYGEPFNESDVVERDLPCSRLISAGQSNNIWFVYYETSARAHNHELIFFEIVNNKIIDNWSFISSFQESVDFNNAIERIKNGDKCFVTLIPPMYSYSRELERQCVSKLGNVY